MNDGSRDLEKEDSAYERQDFRVATKNKQLNKTLRRCSKSTGAAPSSCPTTCCSRAGPGKQPPVDRLKEWR